MERDEVDDGVWFWLNCARDTRNTHDWQWWEETRGWREKDQLRGEAREGNKERAWTKKASYSRSLSQELQPDVDRVSNWSRGDWQPF